jgi:hypothetical protein
VASSCYSFGGKTTICPFSSTCGYAPTTLQALQHAQIPPAAFNLYLLALSLLDALITVGLGVLIFWKKSEQLSGWLASLVLLLLGAGLLTGDTSSVPLPFPLPRSFYFMNPCHLGRSC